MDENEGKDVGKKEESTEDKVKDAAQDTANAVKDGASLAKNIASQNYVGIVKDAFNLLKNKRVRRMILISLFMPIILMTVIVASLFSIFNSVGEAITKIAEDTQNWISNNYTYGIIFYTDEQLEAIIKSIEDLNISLDDLHLMGDIDYDKDDPEREEKEKKALKKYLIKFLIAEGKTSTLNPRPDGEWWDIKYFDDKIAQENIKKAIKMMDANQELTYGNVYVHRTRTNDDTSTDLSNQLQYLYYGNVQAYLDNNDSNILNYFSVDPDGYLVYAKETTIITENSKTVDGRESKEKKEEKKYTLERINYKTAISQYTTPLPFFIYLTMISQNPEFASEVAELAAKGEIRLMIMDNVSESTETSKYEYTEHKKEVIDEGEEGAGEAEDPESEDDSTNYKQEVSESKIVEETKITTKQNIPQLAIVYANTWFSEQEITYVKNITGPTTSEPYETKMDDDAEPEDLPLTEPDEVTWYTDRKITTQTTSTKTEYVESVHGNVVDKTDDFIKLLDKEYKIPNSTRKETPRENFISGAEWLCKLLEMNPQCQNLEQVIRYILYKYTGKSYGVTDLDFNIFDAKEFKSISIASDKQLQKDYIHYFEGTKKNADGTKYVIYDDGAGNLTVGYGIAINASGYSKVFEEAGYTIKEGEEVDIDFVDAIEDEILNNYTDNVKSVVSGLDLKNYQIQALVSRAYNCGITGALREKRGSPSRNFVDSYKAYWNDEKDDLFKKDIKEADFSNKLYTEYMSQPVTSGSTYMAGLEKRRKSEWTLFQTGYYDVLRKIIHEGRRHFKCSR